MTLPPLICVSASEVRTAELLQDGPRRDFVELARATAGTIVYREGDTAGRRWWSRIVGPHLRQAWQVSGTAATGQPVFADGEHIGIPLAFFLWMRRKQSPLTMIGHLPSRPWKRALLRVVSRLHKDGVVVVHSTTQHTRIAGDLDSSWKLELVPYQVDTDFWRSSHPAPEGQPLILAVGAEHRDYAVLVDAARTLGNRVQVVIAAGSHWAREDRHVEDLPSNVEFLTSPLPFDALRDHYERATVVVVPLEAVENQSGVTTILEAMSMERPVIVTASEGQRECVRGPLVREDGVLDEPATADRGPQVFDPEWTADAAGCYVEHGDARALAAAIELICSDRELARAYGLAGSRAARRYFRTEQFAERLAALVQPAAGSGVADDPVQVLAL